MGKKRRRHSPKSSKLKSKLSKAQAQLHKLRKSERDRRKAHKKAMKEAKKRAKELAESPLKRYQKELETERKQRQRAERILKEQTYVSQQKSVLGRTRRHFREGGGISGITSRIQMKTELKARGVLGRLASRAKGAVGKELRQIRTNLTSTPKVSPLHDQSTLNFLKAIEKNPKMGSQAKARAARTFLKKRTTSEYRGPLGEDTRDYVPSDPRYRD